MQLPSQVKLVEVGPRDGLQNQSAVISIKHRVAFIEHLANCGFIAIEAGSLVSPQRLPQMADSEIVYQSIHQQLNTQYIMLVANQKGLARAMACQAKTIAVFCAATDAFSLNNINCSVDESMETIQAIVHQAKTKNISVRGYISCVLGCPYQGDVPVASVVNLAAQMSEMGCYEISLGDTIGIGTPLQAKKMVETVAEKVPVSNLALHFHDTRGQALANIYACLELGVSVIDASVAGLGGCPYAQGASGNVATEDVVYMLHGMGIETGVDLEKLIEAGRFISNVFGRAPQSKVTCAS